MIIKILINVTYHFILIFEHLETEGCFKTEACLVKNASNKKVNIHKNRCIKQCKQILRN